MESLPRDILIHIYNYIPLEYLVVADKERYTLYHSKLVDKISRERLRGYLRNVIRLDYSYILKQMIEDYREQWNKKVTYHYKNTTYPSYSVYLLNYSKEIGSVKCNQLIKQEYNTELKQHKKVRYTKSRWSY